MRAWMLVAVSVVLGCSSEEEGASAVDAAADVATSTDATNDTASNDAASDTTDEDAASDTTDEDAGSDADDAASDASAPVDASTDGATDAASATDASPDTMTRPGQCWLSSHCGAGLTCAADGPGGVCNGCDGSSCESPFTCGGFGACTLDCDGDGDCIPGTRCVSGSCRLKTCSTSADCPATLACRPLSDGGALYCLRARCDSAACPGGTTCRDTSSGKLCVEGALLY